ncbi:hypothetical protein Ae706Ps2_4508 [Pseudonocardia sp. Ae706_Ps2]|nr:hypothetical protein Ae706Ps2_4508 [Pseudonocardia sp. Ae706_Ps2]
MPDPEPDPSPVVIMQGADEEDPCPTTDGRWCWAAAG